MSEKPIPRSAYRYEFYSKVEYFEELLECVSTLKRGDRVSLATMSFDPEDPYVKRISSELASAARRGVRVIVMIDAYSFLASEGALPGPLFYRSKLPKKLYGKFRIKKTALDTIKRAGGKYVITNLPVRPFTLPFAGRSHIKFGVINNRVYIGGCNLSESSHIDIMTGWEDRKTADYLFDLAEKTVESGSVAKVLGGQDTSFNLDNGATIYIDSGKTNRSLIFETAFSMIDKTKKQLYFTCQYFPNERTAEKLAGASGRGVDLRLVFNHPNKHEFPFNFLHYFVLQFEKMKHPDALFAGQLPKVNNYLHAKLLVSDHGTLIGSHNYVSAGVKFGTAEIALLHPDPRFGLLAIQTLNNLLHTKNME